MKPDDGRHGPLLAGFAQELFYGGCFDSAAAMAREALAVERARAKPDLDAFTMSGVALASILVEWPAGTADEAQALDESVALARECLERVESAHADEVRRSGQQLFLGDVLVERARRRHDPTALDEAQALVLSAAAAREKHLTKDDWRTQIARATVGMVQAVRMLCAPAANGDAADTSERRAA